MRQIRLALKNTVRRQFVLLLMMMLCNIPSFSQRQRNYIYVFDCTKSLIKNGIWQKDKDFMLNDIQQLDSKSNVTIVLFHQGVASPIRFKASDFDRQKVEKVCDEMIEESTNTGICNAWDKSLAFLDSKRNNYLYLFTDGKENVNAGRTDAVCQRIREWCNLSLNNYAFFVTLPSKELDNSPEVQKLKAATRSCDRTFYISSRFGAFGAFDKTDFTLNSHYLKPLKVGFSDFGTFKASVLCNDPYFKVSLKDGVIKGGKAVLVVEQKVALKDNTGIHPIHVKISAPSNVLHITNPDFVINIDTRILANLDLAQPSGIESGQYDGGVVETYDAFLFKEGREVATATVNLGASFNEEAKKRGGQLSMTIHAPSQYQFRYNGKEINGQFVISSQDKESVLEVIVPNNSEEGEIVFEIDGQTSSLETINAEETHRYTSSIRFEHNVVWNPLKTIMFWGAVVIFLALVVWFAVLRPYCYPRIRLSRILINCEEDNFYESKSINSARSVVIGPLNGKQGFLSRFFTRRIVYVNAPCCSSVWELKPKGRKKELRASLHGKYLVSPITSNFVAGQTYQLTDKQTNKIITVTL